MMANPQIVDNEVKSVFDYFMLYASTFKVIDCQATEL